MILPPIFRRHLPSILLSILSGLLYVFSFAPWNIEVLQWIAFVPLFFGVALLEKSFPSTQKGFYKRLFFLGFIPCLMLTFGGFYWVAFAVEHYGELPAWLSLLILILFACVGQLQIPFFLCLRAWAKTRVQLKSGKTLTPWFAPLAGAALYVGIESLFPKLFSDTAGNAFFRSVWTRQIVEFAGPFLLTFCSLFVNIALFEFLRSKRPLFLAQALGLLILIHAYGAIRTSTIQKAIDLANQGPKMNVALIQANIGDYLKVASEHGSLNASREVMDQYLGYSTKAIQNTPKPDLIVWPETAYPSVFGQAHSAMDHEMEFRLREFQKSFQGTMAFGGYDHDFEGNDYNALFFFSGEPPQIYHKVTLLQFGETLPGADYFPAMKRLFPMMGFFGHGAGPEVDRVQNSAKISFMAAPSICYEALFSGFSRGGTDLGSDFLLNVTNDSWFGEYGEPYLHLALTTYRGIETRQYMVRATNTGFSVVVDPLGEITQSTELFKPGILSAAIPKRLDTWRAPSFLEPLFLHLCQAWALFLLGWMLFTVARRSKKRPSNKLAF